MAKPSRPPQKQTVGIAEFKARCLELPDGVGTRGDEIVVTKRGKPIGQTGPIRPDVPELKGMYAGKMKILGDLVNFNVADEWKASR
jgi:antitoxin (DNA-binding transcriptional repressor) of toxin-antitoxin stability system